MMLKSFLYAVSRVDITVIQLPKNVTLAYDGLKVRINNYD